MRSHTTKNTVVSCKQKKMVCLFLCVSRSSLLYAYTAHIACWLLRDMSGDLSGDPSGVCLLVQQHVHGRHNLAAGVGRTGAVAALGEVRSTNTGGANSWYQLGRGEYPYLVTLRTLILNPDRMGKILECSSNEECVCTTAVCSVATILSGLDQVLNYQVLQLHTADTVGYTIHVHISIPIWLELCMRYMRYQTPGMCLWNMDSRSVYCAIILMGDNFTMLSRGGTARIRSMVAGKLSVYNRNVCIGIIHVLKDRIWPRLVIFLLIALLLILLMLRAYCAYCSYGSYCAYTVTRKSFPSRPWHVWSCVKSWTMRRSVKHVRRCVLTFFFVYLVSVLSHDAENKWRIRTAPVAQSNLTYSIVGHRSRLLRFVSQEKRKKLYDTRV